MKTIFGLNKFCLLPGRWLTSVIADCRHYLHCLRLTKSVACSPQSLLTRWPNSLVMNIPVEDSKSARSQLNVSLPQ